MYISQNDEKWFPLTLFGGQCQALDIVDFGCDEVDSCGLDAQCLFCQAVLVAPKTYKACWLLSEVSAVYGGSGVLDHIDHGTLCNKMAKVKQ